MSRYYYSPTDSGADRFGAAIASGVQGGTGYYLQGQQEQQRRKEQEDARRLEQERYAAAEAERKRLFDMQYGPRIERALAYQPRDLGAAPDGRPMPKPEVTTSARTAPIVGMGGNPIDSVVIRPQQTLQTTPMERRAGVFHDGEDYRDFTQSFGYQQGQFAQTQEKDRAQRELAQRIENLLAAGVDPDQAFAVAQDENFANHYYATQLEGERQRGRLEVEALRNQYSGGSGGVEGEAGLSRSQARLRDNDAHARAVREAQGNAATWAQYGQSLDHISRWVRTTHGLPAGEANRIAMDAIRQHQAPRAKEIRDGLLQAYGAPRSELEQSILDAIAQGEDPDALIESLAPEFQEAARNYISGDRRY
jgi:hypothetical protein